MNTPDLVPLHIMTDNLFVGVLLFRGGRAGLRPVDSEMQPGSIKRPMRMLGGDDGLKSSTETQGFHRV